jgi:hypothetical protein
MKKIGFYQLASFLVLILMSSCYQDIDLNKYRAQNGGDLLTINSIINPDSTIAVAATKTYFFSDVHNERTFVKDLLIDMYINGERKGSLTFNSDTQFYTRDVKPTEHDEVTLKTQYGDSLVNCTDVIPPKVKIEDVTVSRQGPMSIYTDNDYIFIYNITFTDSVDADNYYFLQYDTEKLTQGVHMGERVFSNEYVFQQLARQINANIPGWEPYSPDGLPFSDYGINGQTHTLVVKEIVQGGNGVDLTRYKKMIRTFKLYSISKNYYDYLLSLIYNDSTADGLHAGMIDIGVTEPIKYFSNINGGLGIFAAYSLDEVTIDVMSITGVFAQ